MRAVALLESLIALDPWLPENHEALSRHSKELESEAERFWASFEADDFHEVQHYIMACESPGSGAYWKESLDSRMRLVVSKLKKSEQNQPAEATEAVTRPPRLT